ncbi:nucleotide-diphospho-sugar transferase [Hortaea werneckii]|nr:nucleotide-diphospho-sugar transferase [Hortaea werneckii]KAI7303026.1 nucleotide-diphospho-sugar transferase [Hortaea werneckii]
MAANEPEDVYCTLVMSDSYLPGAAVLAHSLRDAGTKKKLACLATGDTLTMSTIRELQSLYDYVIPIDRIGNPHPANLYLMNRPDLLYTFSKINLWRLTQFRKVVYLDSDVVALRAPDELFEGPESFAAAPDIGWPDIFNTGVMVLKPDEGEYWGLRTMALAGDSFDGADQGLLNQYFEHRPWKRLSFTYNCTPSGSYQYEPAYRYFKSKVNLVHFIGSHKPWQKGRSAEGVAGGYQELLGRWWAVYDKHFHVPTHEYAATGRRHPVAAAIEDQHRSSATSNYYATGYPINSTGPAPPLEAQVGTTELPMTEPTDAAEAVAQGLMRPEPTAQQRKFSAPSMEWDATRAAPPATSKPEASNFPSTSYEFSSSRDLFKPPAQYPEPPRDMWYEVPKEKPRKEMTPPPIFPWEQRDRPQPARKFAEDEPLPPPTSAEDDMGFAGADELEVSARDDPVEPKTPTIKITPDNPWGGFGTINKNAWDDVSGIENYVRALTAAQRSPKASPSTSAVTSPTGQRPPPPRGSGHKRHPSSIDVDDTHILSPTNEPEPADLIDAVKHRRESASLRLTDFPTAAERPSLPVTPAPRRKQPTFWGDDRDEAEMPSAEGVPEQSEWNPEIQLEQLRRSSLTVSDLKLPSKEHSLPSRTMPSTTSALPIPEEHGPISTSATGTTGTAGTSQAVPPKEGV